MSASTGRGSSSKSRANHSRRGTRKGECRSFFRQSPEPARDVLPRILGILFNCHFRVLDPFWRSGYNHLAVDDCVHPSRFPVGEQHGAAKGFVGYSPVFIGGGNRPRREMEFAQSATQELTVSFGSSVDAKRTGQAGDRHRRSGRQLPAIAPPRPRLRGPLPVARRHAAPASRSIPSGSRSSAGCATSAATSSASS